MKNHTSSLACKIIDEFVYLLESNRKMLNENQIKQF